MKNVNNPVGIFDNTDILFYLQGFTSRILFFFCLDNGAGVRQPHCQLSTLNSPLSAPAECSPHRADTSAVKPAKG